VKSQPTNLHTFVTLAYMVQSRSDGKSISVVQVMTTELAN